MKPYYAVIFTSKKAIDVAAYAKMAVAMEQLAKKQPGFIGVESARETVGITVSYWESEAAILQWKQQLDHQMAQKMGKENWYSWYKVRVCLVEREYEFTSSNTK